MLQKGSALPEVSGSNPCYSLAGAVYGVYSDSGLASRVGSIETDGSGSGKLGELDSRHLLGEGDRPRQGLRPRRGRLRGRGPSRHGERRQRRRGRRRLPQVRPGRHARHEGRRDDRGERSPGLGVACGRGVHRALLRGPLRQRRGGGGVRRSRANLGVRNRRRRLRGLRRRLQGGGSRPLPYEQRGSHPSPRHGRHTGNQGARRLQPRRRGGRRAQGVLRPDNRQRRHGRGRLHLQRAQGARHGRARRLPPGQGDPHRGRGRIRHRAGGRARAAARRAVPADQRIRESDRLSRDRREGRARRGGLHHHHRRQRPRIDPRRPRRQRLGHPARLVGGLGVRHLHGARGHP